MSDRRPRGVRPTALEMRYLLPLIALLILAWALRNISIPDLLVTLRSLSLWKLFFLFLINWLIISLFALRLWIIFQARGTRLSFYRLLRYWLAGFSFSYFTPGPQFGGGFVQFYFISTREEIPLPESISGVASSQIIERIGNTIFLLFGMLAITKLGWLDTRTERIILAVSIAVITLPLVYFIALYKHKLPLKALAHALSRKSNPESRGHKLLLAILDGEGQLALDTRERPITLVFALLITLASWAAVALQAWLALSYFGHILSIIEIILLLTIVQIAFLFPAPAGLGFMEAGTVLALQLIGYSRETGLALAALVRLRDVFFGGLGLLFGGHLAWSMLRDRSTDIISDQFESNSSKTDWSR
jgi:uncharacterized protein (TIRG00374 family)